MKIKRCALVAAVVLAGCTVAFLCRNRSVSESRGVAEKSAAPIRAVTSAALTTGAALAAPVAEPASNQTATVRGTRPYVLTCEENFNTANRRAAEALGVKTVEVLSRKSLLVEADAAAVARLRASGKFSVEREFLPSDKIAPALAAQIAGGAETVDVTFLTLSEEDRKIVQGRIAARGGKILGGCLNTEDIFSARLPAGLVAELASCGDVRWMEQFVRPQLMNNIAVGPELMNVSNVWLSAEFPEGLSGAGQFVSTSDSGIDLTHPDLVNQVVWTNVVDGCYNHDVDGHGTHTAGSIVGDGTMWTNETAAVRGTAWGAKLCAWFCGRPDGKLSTPSSYDQLFCPDQENFPAYIHSASWGVSQNGEYTARCESMDRYLWEHPEFLPVFSAGNEGRDGSGTIGDPASAKNVLTVGATQSSRTGHDGGWGNGNPTKTAVFSSRGPCKDGRTKPDIAAPGVGILSTRSYEAKYDIYGVDSNTNYAYDSGTSMACPLTAGAVALVREWLMTNAAAWKVEGEAEIPTAALMKAIVTGGAKDAAVPNNDQGWGRVDVMETLAPSNRAVKLIDRIPFADGEEFSWIVETTNAAPLDVQLVWVDYPASSSGSQETPRLVNDLDLSVVPLDGDGLYYGNGGTSPDTLNNIESVRLDSAGRGQYLVTVSCREIPYDYRDGGAAALYIRGAFDPDTVVERYTVRIVKSPGQTNTYARLDRALAAASAGDVIEILEPTQLRDPVAIGVDCTIVATNDDPYASAIVRPYEDTFLIVTNGATLAFSNVVFAESTEVPVEVREGSRVSVAGTVDFGVPYDQTALVTADAAGFVLSGPIDPGFTLDCAVAQTEGLYFGSADCDFETASNAAARIVCANDKLGELRGEAVEEGGVIRLRWVDDETRVPLADAAGYYVGAGNVTNTRARINRLFERFEAALADGTVGVARELVILRPGALSRPLKVGGNVTIRGEGNPVVDCSAMSGFTVTNGTLTVSGITFSGYENANGLFLVEGGKLVLDGVGILNAKGTKADSGAVVVRDGAEAELIGGTVLAGCSASGSKLSVGKRKGYGGGVTVDAGGSLLLGDCTITNCWALNNGGGIYVAGLTNRVVLTNGVAVVRDNTSGSTTSLKVDDLYVAGTNGTVIGTVGLPGEGSAVGVLYGLTGGVGNREGDVFSRILAAVSDTNLCAEAFFNDTSAELSAGVVDDTDLISWRRLTQVGSKKDGSGMRVAVSNLVDRLMPVLYYRHVEQAFAEIVGDSIVLLRTNDTFDADIEVKANVVLTTDFGRTSVPARIERTGNSSIVVGEGGSLTVGKAGVYGCPFDEDTGNPRVGIRSVSLIRVNGGGLTLDADSEVAFAFGDGGISANAVAVRDNGTFRMVAGSVIRDCGNSHNRSSVECGFGGGLYVQSGTVHLEGGAISNCFAAVGGGAFIGSGSKVYVSGDTRITDNTTPNTAVANNLVVSDVSGVILTDVFTGAIGYVEGVSADTNVFGRVGTDFSGTAADMQASAHRFTHDVTGDIGMAVSDGSETLLVWGSALKADGTFDRKDSSYALVDGAKARVNVPVAVPLVYTNGVAQVGVPEGVGYFITGNVATDAGNYTARATPRPGFVWAEPDGSTDATNIAWSIAKATYDLSEIRLKNGVFPYDGYEHSLAIEGTLPEGLAVTYSGNNLLRQPGTNEVTATITVKVPSANWKLVPDPTVLTAKLIVLPAGGGDPTPPDPPQPHWEVVTTNPTAIAFKSIDRVNDTEWCLVITDRVEYCNYRLLWTTNLVEGFVSTGAWEHAVGEAASSEWKTNVITTGGAYFWRAEGKDGTNMVLKIEE